ncbi:MAG TPA: TetR/AcrR family transcriptional regulator [Polyangiaceae bacterium]|jgi:TetR/AcrR family transcriptional regulator|nr:TetR/AcrR family transcriptional regulator [Polyangiaceae bacterium]
MERILDAAEDEFAARGFAGARLREIARAAGVQPALIHHYFVDKKGLYEAVVRRAVDQMSTASWRVLSSETDLDGIVRGFIDVMVDFSDAHRKLLSIMRSELLTGAGELLAVVRERSQPILDAIVAITERLQKAGDVRADVDPRDIVRAGLSLVLYPVVDAPVLEALLPEPEDGDPAATLSRRKHVVSGLLLAAIRKLPA